jgi:hypothetical protein
MTIKNIITLIFLILEFICIISPIVLSIILKNVWCLFLYFPVVILMVIILVIFYILVQVFN